MTNIALDPDAKLLTCSFCGKNQNEVRKLIADPTVHNCDECVDLCNDIISEEVESDASVGAKSEGDAKQSRKDGLCGICMEPRETDELIFLPHAAYMCAGCLEDIQTVRDKHGDR